MVWFKYCPISQPNMSRYFKTLRDENPEKYPSKLGEKWSDEEESKLRQAIKMGIPKNEISKTLGRTIGGINSQRRKIAAEYYFNDKKQIDEIMKITGLTKEEIEDTIERRKNYNNIKENTNIESLEIPSDIIELKKDVKEIKENVRKILELMNAVYEF